MLLGLLAVGGLLLSASGIVSIKASSGHWRITKWFLNFSMSRSVETHSMGIEAPLLDVDVEGNEVQHILAHVDTGRASQVDQFDEGLGA